MSEKINKHVTDLGVGAYLLMHGYEVVDKKGRAIYFSVNKEDLDKFDKLTYEYLSSPYHRFDSCLMSLKKIPEYSPPI